MACVHPCIFLKTCPTCLLLVSVSKSAIIINLSLARSIEAANLLSSSLSSRGPILPSELLRGRRTIIIFLSCRGLLVPPISMLSFLLLSIFLNAATCARSGETMPISAVLYPGFINASTSFNASPSTALFVQEVPNLFSSHLVVIILTGRLSLFSPSISSLLQGRAFNPRSQNTRETNPVIKGWDR